MKKNEFSYHVTLYARNKEIYTLKIFTSLQNARKFIKKERDITRWGLSIKDNMAFRIYKINNATNHPETIYLI